MNEDIDTKAVKAVEAVEVSIIIPAYNCEKTIAQTVKSLLNQTFSNFELFIINDGSTDNTDVVIRKLAKTDFRIKLVTVQNGGPANARNTGLSKAQGEYIYFMDSDDEVELEMLFKMVSLIKENFLDVVCCGYFMDTVSATGDKKSSQIFSMNDLVLKNPIEVAKYILPLCDKHLMYVVWNKLYKKDFLLKNQLDFPNYMSGEDRLFNLNCIEKLSSLGVIKTPLYHYYIRTGNSLAGRYIQNRFAVSLLCIKSMEQIIAKFNITDEKHIEMANFATIKQIMASISQLFSKTCPLSKEEKNADILKIITNEEVIAAVNSKTSGFNYTKIVKLVLKSQNLTLIKLLAGFIVFFQTKFSALFLKIKHSQK